MSRLGRLGTRIANEQERFLNNISTTPASTNMGEYLLRRKDVRRHRRVALGMLGLLLVSGSGALIAYRSQIRPSTEITTVYAEAGQTLATTSSEMAVVFTDGSEALLLPGAKLHTLEAKGVKTNIRLERGRLRVHVIHQDHTAFAVHSGPYTVEVTGTRFHVDWQPESRTFSTEVSEGSVRIHGGLLPEPVTMQKGQSLTLEAGKSFPEPLETKPSTTLAKDPQAPPVPTLMEPSVAPNRAPSFANRTTPHRRPAMPRLASVSDWRSQALAGRYREALKLAEKHGFENICRETSKEDLLTLAEAARYAGRAKRSMQALLALRFRFPSSEDAALAAYLLGRLTAEVYNDHFHAARWFRTYLSEKPTGKLAQEANGRLLESLAFMDRAAAQKAAKSYLDRYPKGPHAPFARNLLGL